MEVYYWVISVALAWKLITSAKLFYANGKRWMVRIFPNI